MLVRKPEAVKRKLAQPQEQEVIGSGESASRAQGFVSSPEAKSKRRFCYSIAGEGRGVVEGRFYSRELNLTVASYQNLTRGRLLRQPLRARFGLRIWGFIIQVLSN